MPVQRTILWIVFSMSILFLWDKWMALSGKPSMFAPTSPAVSAKKETSGASGPNGSSTGTQASADDGKKVANDIPGGAAITPSTNVPNTANIPAANSSSPAVGGVQPTNAGAVGTAKLVNLKNDLLSLDIDSLGGQIRRSELLAHKDTEKKELNVLLFQDQPGKVYLAQSGLTGAPQGISYPNHRTLMQVVDESKTVLSSSGAVGDKVVAKFASESGGVKLTRTYSLTRGSYVIDVKDEITNTGASAVQPTLYLQLARDTHKAPGESQFYSTYTGPAVYSDIGKFQKVDFSTIEKKKGDYVKSAADGWAGIIQHYFVAAWIPADKTQREFYTSKIDDKDLYTVGMKQPLKEIAPNTSISVESRLYVGPQDQQEMAKVAPGLDLTVDYGWLTVIAKPIFWLLQYLHSLVNNWGWAIVLLTIVIKTIFFPLQAASYKSMARMKAVTPKMTALRERFGDDKMKLNQAMMGLYKTEKINPLGGCLPVVVQIPVFISLYWVLLASVEMRSAPWMLWIKDLAAPDPWYILPLLMAGTMFIQMRLNPTPPDPIQAKMMQIMPIIFSVMFFFFPSGLVLYWLVNNLYSIAQQWYITNKIANAPAQK
jgi:YidC/Oxa1 family membrane protein insertase